MKNKCNIIKDFNSFSSSNNYQKVTTNRFVYYLSSSSLRSQIQMNGITPKDIDKSFNINKPAIVLINSYDKSDWFNLEYNDIWQIDTHLIDNIFYKDPNLDLVSFQDYKYVFTFDPIPSKSIKIYHKGSIKNLLN